MASLTVLSSVKSGAEVLGVDRPSAAFHSVNASHHHPAAERLGHDGFRWEKPEDLSTDVSRVVLCEQEKSSPEGSAV